MYICVLLAAIACYCVCSNSERNFNIINLKYPNFCALKTDIQLRAQFTWPCMQQSTTQNCLISNLLLVLLFEHRKAPTERICMHVRIYICRKEVQNLSIVLAVSAVVNHSHNYSNSLTGLQLDACYVCCCAVLTTSLCTYVIPTDYRLA